MANNEQLRDQAVGIIDNFMSTIQALQDEIAVKDSLIDLIGPDIEWWEKNLIMRSSERMQKIIGAYRIIKPKDGGTGDEKP